MWDRRPHLPPGWTSSAAEILGRRVEVVNWQNWDLRQSATYDSSSVSLVMSVASLQTQAHIVLPPNILQQICTPVGTVWEAPEETAWQQGQRLLRRDYTQPGTHLATHPEGLQSHELGAKESTVQLRRWLPVAYRSLLLTSKFMVLVQTTRWIEFKVASPRLSTPILRKLSIRFRFIHV